MGVTVQKHWTQVHDSGTQIKSSVHSSINYNASKSRYGRKVRGEFNKQREVNNRQAKTPGKKRSKQKAESKYMQEVKKQTRSVLYCFVFLKTGKLQMIAQ